MKILLRNFESENQTKSVKRIIFKALIVMALFAVTNNGFSQGNALVVSRSSFEAGVPQNTTMIGKFRTFSSTINPSVQIADNQVKSIQPNALCLYTDYTSVRNIHTLKFNKSKIEYATIRIKNPSEITSIIALARFSSFPNLKFIHVIFEYEISNTQMASMLNNAPANCYVIYESRIIM